ncbi:MAG: hypothetical protein AAGD35_11435 [Actinomycetota bacterium]
MKPFDPSDSPIQLMAGAAAAVVYESDLIDDGGTQSTTSFAVHPHIEEVDKHDPVLLGYLESIYAGRNSIGAADPAADEFNLLSESELVTQATEEIAGQLAHQMTGRKANRGIVFGFLTRVNDSFDSYGIIKIDLNENKRFHFDHREESGWSLVEVRDMLPPLREQHAKYVISPQPNGTARVGVRDESSGQASGARYLLDALGLVIPRTTATKLAVGKAALKAGVDIETTHDRLRKLETDTTLRNTVDLIWPDSDDGLRDEAVEKLAGPPHRPLEVVQAKERLIRVYKSRNPYLLIEADEDVEIRREGPGRFVIELPGLDDTSIDVVETDFKLDNRHSRDW